MQNIRASVFIFIGMLIGVFMGGVAVFRVERQLIGQGIDEQVAADRFNNKYGEDVVSKFTRYEDNVYSPKYISDYYWIKVSLSGDTFSYLMPKDTGIKLTGTLNAKQRSAVKEVSERILRFSDDEIRKALQPGGELEFLAPFNSHGGNGR